MRRKYCLLIVLLSVFTIGTVVAKDVVVCGTVVDLSAEKAPVALPCSVSVHVGCSATEGDLYFAKTNTNGYYSLTAGLPDNCTKGYLFVFTGKTQNHAIATVQVRMPQDGVTDTLRQNLQLMIIDEAMPATIPDSIVADWKDQDGTDYATAIASIKTAYPSIADKITGTGEQGYLSACHWRRVARLKPYPEIANIICARHYDFGGIHVGYHDNSDSSNTDWPGSNKDPNALCILNFNNYYPILTDLMARTEQVLRDPCISFDGKKVVFAISGKGAGKGYKIYEMEIADTATLKQLTNDDSLGAVVADFEPCYLPNGDIMFTSTRNFTSVSGEFNPATNMFLMNSQGKYMRQVGFDQASTFYPVVMDDGSVLYTRWEYNDRDITNVMGLFTMYPDGSHQTEYFGNQTGWPFTQIHGRPVPGTKGSKVMCIAGGHHGTYSGELMMIDRSKGTNGAACIQMLAPVREATPTAKKSDMAMGNVNFLFQNPLPLDEENCIVSWRKSESARYKLYFMNIDGSRELIAWGSQSVSQPVLLQPRKVPSMPALQANYNDSMGTFTMQNVYYGEGMKGVAKGTAKSLRVVKLSYRESGIAGNFGQTMGSGPSGFFTPAITCPISTYGASREAKEVLGEAKIYADGSAAFKVPARTPVYFQVIDTNGYCIATMRSWSTLMPGEKFSCTGCHESKVEAPPTGIAPLAGASQNLDKPLGIENRPFDYIDIVQPILDKKCVSCHKSGTTSGPDLSGTLVTSSSRQYATSYQNLTKGISRSGSNDYINICTIFSTPEQKQPYSFGSSLSPLMTTAINGTNDKMNTLLTKTEKNIIACWLDLAAPSAGTYSSYLTNASGYEKLMEKRKKWQELEAKNIKDITTAAMPNGHRMQFTRSSTEQMGIVYLPTRRALVLNINSPGNLMLVDLRGRVIYRVQLADRLTDATITLPASLSRGLYVARYIGDGLTLQRMVSITR